MHEQLPMECAIDCTRQQREALDQHATKIAQLQADGARAFFAICVELLHMHQAVQGKLFRQFVEDDPRVDIAPRTALEYVQIAKQEDAEQVASFGVAKARQLMRVKNLDKRRAFLQDNDIASMTVKRLTEKITDLLDLDAGVASEQPTAGATQSTESSMELVMWAHGVMHTKFRDLYTDSLGEVYERLRDRFADDSMLSASVEEAKAILDEWFANANQASVRR